MDDIKLMVLAFLDISKLLAMNFKDGVQATDINQIIDKIKNDETLKTELMNAYNAIDKVKAEAKTLTFLEIVELGVYAVPKLVDVIAAVKK